MILFLFFIFMAFAFFIMNNLKIVDFEQTSSTSAKDAPIAVIEVEGVILKAKKYIELLHQAEKDESIKAIIVRINSPGGAVGPTQEIYDEIRRIDETKPVYASFGAIAASGGYYLGAGCRKIYASAGTLTGSIGVIMQFMDMSKLYEWAKMRPEIIKAGKYKDIGSPHRSMNLEEKRLMDKMILGVHEQFINDIAQTRKNKIIGDLLDYTKGQVFSGEAAFKAGLVDELAGLWPAARKIHADLDLEADFEIRFLKKKKKFDWTTIIEDMEEEARAFVYNFFANKGATPMFLYQ